MSTFGDRTPKQEILNWLEYVQAEYDLSWVQLVQFTCEVIAYILEREHDE